MPIETAIYCKCSLLPEIHIQKAHMVTYLAHSVFRGVRTVLSKAELHQRLQEVGRTIMARLKKDPLTT